MISASTDRVGRSSVDPSGRSSRAAGQGFRALAEGDTVLTRQKYTEAGDILAGRAEAARTSADRHLLRYLAASQYYRAGEYKRALRLTHRVERKYLRPPLQPKLDELRKQVEERADAGYARRIREAVINHWKKGEVEAAIKVLQDHPYVLERSALAWFRADLCFQSGKWYEAALFHADSVRFSNSHPDAVFQRASGVFALLDSGRSTDATEYVRHLIENEPTALDYVVGFAIRYPDFLRGDRPAGESGLELFAEAEPAFAALPEATQADSGVRAMFAHGYLLAALAADGFGRRAQALELIRSGMNFAPVGPDLEALRSILADPDQWFSPWRQRVSVVPTTVLESQQARRNSLESTVRNAA
jgi:tetratricopeptide (TPR) repeat protein